MRAASWAPVFAVIRVVDVLVHRVAGAARNGGTIEWTHRCTTRSCRILRCGLR